MTGDGYPSDWRDRRERVLRRDHYRCRNCRRYRCDLEVHHAVPKANGGSHRETNLITLCERCHKNVPRPSVQATNEQDESASTVVMPAEQKLKADLLTRLKWWFTGAPAVDG